MGEASKKSNRLRTEELNQSIAMNSENSTAFTERDGLTAPNPASDDAGVMRWSISRPGKRPGSCAATIFDGIDAVAPI